MELRPRDASPPRRRSFRIVARGDGEPTLIRITRPVLPASAQLVAPDTVHTVDEVSEPPSPVSISSASSERTLSSESSSSESDVTELGEVLNQPVPQRPNRDYLEFIRSFVQDSFMTQQVNVEDLRQDSTGLLNRPQVIHFINHHSGRAKCLVCDERIHGDQVRIDYRPYSRSAAVKHVHVECAGRNRQLYYPASEALLSFAEAEFSLEEQQQLLTSLRDALPPATQIQHRVVRLYPVVRGGDAHERELERREHMQRVASQQSRYLHARSEMIRRIGGGLFSDRFGGAPPELHRGVNPGILGTLPRVQIPLALDIQEGEEGHNCVICLEPMEGGQTVIVLPCFHRYHEDCITNWFRNSKLCPIDKLDVEKLARDGGDSLSIPIV